MPVTCRPIWQVHITLQCIELAAVCKSKKAPVADLINGSIKLGSILGLLHCIFVVATGIFWYSSTHQTTRKR